MPLTTDQEQKLQWAKEQFEQGIFDGLAFHDIGMQLKNAGLDTETRKTFHLWFIRKGLEDGWLFNEMGF